MTKTIDEIAGEVSMRSHRVGESPKDNIAEALRKFREECAQAVFQHGGIYTAAQADFGNQVQRQIRAVGESITENERRLQGEVEELRRKLADAEQRIDWMGPPLTAEQLRRMISENNWSTCLVTREALRDAIISRDTAHDVTANKERLAAIRATCREWIARNLPNLSEVCRTISAKRTCGCFACEITLPIWLERRHQLFPDSARNPDETVIPGVHPLDQRGE